ncbi:sensor histidine kinase [Leptolyngbya sp. 7M]|uniref:sensor histidine kinase n=1 Tax=Leptolyngbya sp. 7M TaxID=2812896 RepID=UPI001B8C2844|nr:ATP-binding protein [Leptolyngbya sp. 7M]QYO63767.1 hypothetical protein JVX88_28620 [Leptolyngbya sp. 7M]
MGVLIAWAVGQWVIRRQLARATAAERRARTAERLAEVGAMTSGLAHEIKNPLSTIGLNAQLLEEGVGDLPIDDAERSRLLRRAAALRREVERLRGILTDFLQYAGEPRLDPRPEDLNRLVEELADFFLPQAAKAGVRLRVDLAQGPLRSPIDPAHLKQAVLNLMLNAVQAMSGGDGSASRELILKTAAEPPAPGRARAAVDAPGGWVVLHVIDTGPGIAPDVAARIFEPYFTTKSGGSGLGLPMTRRLIEAHGGRIDLHTEIGRGSDFVVRLPALESSPEPRALAATATDAMPSQ